MPNAVAIVPCQALVRTSGWAPSCQSGTKSSPKAKNVSRLSPDKTQQAVSLGPVVVGALRDCGSSRIYMMREHNSEFRFLQTSLVQYNFALSFHTSVLTNLCRRGRDELVQISVRFSECVPSFHAP